MDSLYLIFVENLETHLLDHFAMTSGFSSYSEACKFIDNDLDLTNWQGGPSKIHIISCPIMKTIEVKKEEKDVQTAK